MEDNIKDTEIETKEETKAEDGVKEPEVKKPEEPKKEEEPKKTEPEEKEEKKAEDKKVDAELKKLKADVKKLTDKAKQVETITAENETLKTQVVDKDNIIKEYEDLVGKLIETKLEQVPAEYKDLIPENMNLKQKLSWLEKAETKGLFTKEEKKKPNVQIGKPINVDVPKVDTSKLSGMDLMRMAYNTIK